MPAPSPVVVAIDQGTTNTKAVLVDATGAVVATGSSPVGVASPRPGWVEQDAELLWSSAVAAAGAALATAGGAPVRAVALSTQRESVLAWSASTGRALGPVLGWQDRRTAAWCAETVGPEVRADVHRRTGLRVDAMFSAPKLRWLLDHLPAGVALDDVRVGTVDSWLVWRLTGGREHLTEAGNASRTLLYDVARLAWSPELLDRVRGPGLRAARGARLRHAGSGRAWAPASSPTAPRSPRCSPTPTPRCSGTAAPNPARPRPRTGRVRR